MRRPAKGERSAASFGQVARWLGTKIHAAVDAQGTPVRFVLTGGERHDATQAEALIAEISPDWVVGDKGYDSDPLRAQIRRQGAKPVIPSRQGC